MKLDPEPALFDFFHWHLFLSYYKSQQKERLFFFPYLLGRFSCASKHVYTSFLSSCLSQVAAMLWVLAQLGYWISLWSFARLGILQNLIKSLCGDTENKHVNAEVIFNAEVIWVKNLFLNDLFKILTSAIPLTICVRLMGSAFILLVAVRAYFSQFPEVRLTRYPHNDYSGNSEQDELPPIIAPVEERALRTQPVLKEVKVRSFGRSAHMHCSAFSRGTLKSLGSI